MRRRRVYFKRYIPPWIYDEYMGLISAYFGGFSSEQMHEELNEDDMKFYINSHASEEYKLWEKYSSFAKCYACIMHRK